MFDRFGKTFDGLLLICILAKGMLDHWGPVDLARTDQPTKQVAGNVIFKTEGGHNWLGERSQEEDGHWCFAGRARKGVVHGGLSVFFSSFPAASGIKNGDFAEAMLGLC